MATPLLEHILIFCDGACSGNPGPGGWGAIVATPSGEAWEMGGGASSTTNNQMELTAAIEAISSVANLAGPVRVLTDSVYVIRGIKQWIWGWRRNGWKTATGGQVLNREYWEKLSAVVQARGKVGEIEWGYVAGHTGIPGNERADAIAVEFARGKEPLLYRGSVDTYPVDIHAIPENVSLPERGGSSPSGKGGAAYSYLSLVGGSVERHATWAECKKRVDGQPNAKFRKAKSADEEKAILRSWNLDPSHVK